MQPQIPPEVEEKVEEFEDLRDDLAELLEMKNTLEQELERVNQSLQGLEDAPESATAYRQYGEVLIELDHDDIVAGLEEKHDEITEHIEDISERADGMEDHLKDLRDEINQMMEEHMGGAPMGGMGGGNAIPDTDQ